MSAPFTPDGVYNQANAMVARPDTPGLNVFLFAWNTFTSWVSSNPGGNYGSVYTDLFPDAGIIPTVTIN